MSKSRYFLIVLMTAVLPATPARAAYNYWVAYTNTTPGPSGMANAISGVSLSDGNNVRVDYDHDGTPDDEYLGLATGQGFGSSLAVPGTKVESDEPIQLTYYYRFSDHGAYEDGGLSYTVLPEPLIGDEYWVPVAVQYGAILAVTDQTTVSYDADNDGTPENVYALNAGQTQTLAIAAGGHFYSDTAFYLVAAMRSADCYDRTFAFSVLPASLASSFYVVPAQHPYSHPSSTDLSGAHIVAVEDGVTVTIGAAQQTLNAGDVWFYQTAVETEVSADGPVYAVYVSDVQGMDPWHSVMRHYEFAFNLVPEGAHVTRFLAGGVQPGAQGSPIRQLFIASYTDGNQIDFECLDHSGSYTTTLGRGDSFYLHETDTVITCWRQSLMEVTSSAHVHASFSDRGWWVNTSETTSGTEYLGDFCTCTTDGECDDGLYCTGTETCVDCLCVSSGDPCPDDGVYCNGAESCVEETDSCTSNGDPCPDDGVFCNGAESCDEEADACASSGNPCPDDGLYCNGVEFCDENLKQCLSSDDPCQDDGDFCNGQEECDEASEECTHTGDPCADDGLYCNGTESCSTEEQQCVHSGDPCPATQRCDDPTDSCVPLEIDDDSAPIPDDDEDAGWPKGKVTGGCCGC